jgi:hypothetical protein
MALQGSLRDFSISEILQLLGTQRKSGCLVLERDAEKGVVYVTDGRIVSARDAGMPPDDPLVVFLRRIHRISDEQYRGLLTIHQESGRDLEDLLLNGRYFEQEVLAGFVERQILEALLRLSHWESGSYRFEPALTWKGARLVKLSIEGALIESARRIDERKRQRATFADPHQLLGVRDLPSADDVLSEEESELFGIIDGQHTVAEVVEAAPLTEYEAYEALHRMMEAGWVEFVGRREPGAVAAPTAKASAPRAAVGRELVAAAVAVVVALGLAFAGRALSRTAVAPAPADDVFTATQTRDLRRMIELYRRDHGDYPVQLSQLVEDDWITAGDLANPSFPLAYQHTPMARDYQLRADRAR